MKSRRKNVPANRNAIEYSEEPPLPIDLITEILLRLPAKSIARIGCVSKNWASILCRPHFTELFLTKSYARPQLLLAFVKEGYVLFFSSPQPRSNSSSVTVNFSMKFAFRGLLIMNCTLIGGLFCFKHYQNIKAAALVICNPSTGQSLTLPTLMKMRSFLVYDPIEKQFKVLSMTIFNNEVSREHQVMTLGTEKPSWRMIECGVTHYPRCSGICIDGVLYYKATAEKHSSNFMIVYFDVRTEKFGFIQLEEAFTSMVYNDATLFNYNGKLASFQWKSNWYFDIKERNKGFKLCVLQDTEKHEWSQRIYELPTLWWNFGREDRLVFSGVTGANEVVLATRNLSGPVYVVFYSLERKTIRRVEIQGMREGKAKSIYTLINHVENVKLIEAFQNLGHC